MITRLSSLGSHGDFRVRAAIDFAIVNICMLAVWLAVALWRIASADLTGVHAQLSHFANYYLMFCPFAALFPITFAVGGIYNRGLSGRQRAARAAGACALIGITYSVSAFALNDRVMLEHSIAVGFAVLVSLVVPASRLLKEVFVSRYEVAPRDGVAVTNRCKTVLVVGGAGYIGSILVRRLLEQGYQVKVLDKLLYGPGAIQDILCHNRFQLIEGDCRNMKHVVQAVNGVGSIIHLAAIVGDPACELDHRTTSEINYAATRMLIEVAKGDGVRKLVFASSCSVYGATDDMVDETAPAQPISLYGRTKVESEQALMAAADENFQPTILRLATVFGHSYRPRFDLVVNLLTAKAYQEKLITIYNGQQWRPFIHVADIADAMMLVLTARKHLGGEILNVGDSHLNFTLSNIGTKIQKFFPDARIEHIDNSDRRNYRVSFIKIERLLGFQAQWTLEKGILEMKRHLEAGDIRDYRNPSYSNQKCLANAGIPRHAEQRDEVVMAAFAGGAAL
jgi:nucleoside-diphosphate-sugar epimerase